MFERYNEGARRAIFFSRAEASELGCEQIEADFILLGIAREDPSVTVDWLDANYGELRETADRLYARVKKIPTYMDLPLSSAAKRVLAYAAEEAAQLASEWIGTGHLFLGLLREPDTLAAKMLQERGDSLNAVRAGIGKKPARAIVAQESAIAKAGPASAFPMGMLMRLRAQDGKEIAAVAWEDRVPQAGETISLPDKNDGKAYLVEGVRWLLIDDGSSVFRTREVVVTVRDANAK
jgi:ATP-dependent Clp protease ATP-binding subunit ClpA